LQVVMIKTAKGRIADDQKVAVRWLRPAGSG
jgi:hypothetical protein